MNIEMEYKANESEEEDYEIENINKSSQRALEEAEKHQVLFSAESSRLYSSTRPEAKYDFDYEINTVRFSDDLDEECMFIKQESRLLGIKYEKIDPSKDLYDSLDIPYYGDQAILNPMGTTKKAKANLFKRLVSKKKKKITNRIL